MYCNIPSRFETNLPLPGKEKCVPELPPKPPKRPSSDHKIEGDLKPTSLSNHSFSDPSLYCLQDEETSKPMRESPSNYSDTHSKYPESQSQYSGSPVDQSLLNKQRYVSVYEQGTSRPGLWCRLNQQTQDKNANRPGDVQQMTDSNGIARGVPRDINSYQHAQPHPATQVANREPPSSSRDHSQVRGLRENRPLSVGYPRQEYYSNKTHEYVTKPMEVPQKPDSQSPKNQEYLVKPDYPRKQDFSPKDYPCKPSLIPSPHKLTSPSNQSTRAAVPSPMKDKISSQRVISPPTKLLDKVPSPLGKVDPRTHDFKAESGSQVVGKPNPEGGSGHFVQQYPERDTSSIKGNVCPAWEGGYIYMPDQYPSSNGQEIPLSQTPAIPSKPGTEKVIDAQDHKDPNFNPSKQQPTTKPKPNSRLSPLGSDSKGEDFIEKPEKDSEKEERKHKEGKHLPIVVSQQKDIDGLNKLNKSHLVGHGNHPRGFGMRNDGRATPESTDCGSLSKSSSDGDHMINRKRPPTKLKSKRRNILSFPQHLSIEEIRGMQRRTDSYCGSSSSDENRSSGHASMSDGHSSSSPPVDTLPRHNHARSNLKIVPEDDRLSVGVANSGFGGRFHQYSDVQNRRLPMTPRYCGANGQKDDFSLSLEGASGIDDIKQAIEHLTMRSQGSRTSYSTSTYSSMSGSEGEPMRRLVRHSSLETINTNVTSADEFVWVDSHNRLVELQQLPWSNHDVLRVIQQGRIREQLDRVSMEAVPRLSYLLQRALVRVAREAQRLTRPLAMCSKREVSSAFKIVLSPALSDSCIKACLRSAAMYTVCGDQLRQGKSTRAGLNLSVSRFMRWMCDVRLGKFIHEYAAVYMTAGMENLLEEMILQCLPVEREQLLTASALENAIANNGDLWGLLQPYAHLNAGRSATGALCLPRWARGVSLDRISAGSSSSIEMDRELEMLGNGSTSSGSITSGLGGSTSGSSLSDANCSTSNCGVANPPSRCSSSVTLTHEDHQSRNMKVRMSMQSIEQTLLTTCVGSIADLGDQVNRVIPLLNKATNSAGSPKTPVTWGKSALHTLFYFMRCSQLEHAEHISRAPIQELVYERPYIVLPPLVEWVRVATAHTEHRHSTVVDKDDVMQASRLLLPGVDCPVRMIGYEELICPRRQLDEVECAKKFKVDLAFKMLSCGRADLVSHALQLLPTTLVNTVNEYGLTPLMLACIRGDEPMVRMLLQNGASVDCETPPTGPSYQMTNPETQHWTALTYASIHGNISIARTLLEHNANVEGGAQLSEEKCTETPLQVASAAGHLDMMSLLLSHGANPYLSTLMKDSLCYSGAAQKGCYASIAVAAAHGQRTALHKLLAQPQHIPSREVLSLEEILAEGSQGSDKEPHHNAPPVEEDPVKGYPTTLLESSQGIKLSKHQIKTLQEAMYHSAESGHLEMTLDLRNLEVPWTLHCWMHTLATAHEHRLESIIDQLLQDFLQEWPEDYNAQFVDECLPLLFTIFRYSKNEGTSLLLADIFTTCFGKDSIKEIRDTSISAGARIDPKYVNNPELSDVQFRVEGRVFYAHKLILVNASPRFEQMLTSKICEGGSPIVQIHDIRYDIFEFVMQSLYKGGCENLDVDSSDVLELMAAANFFQLDSLLRYCESRCSQQVNLENVVSMYVHAKVYGAMQLLEYCQGFLLQNMVALLTYDDSVRRLIFGKKLHNHDVLSGLLLTLQARIKARASPRAGRKRVIKENSSEATEMFQR